MAVAACLAPGGAAQASCECDLEIEARDFGIYCHETCMAEDGSDLKEPFESHVRALRFGANLWEQLQRDPQLRAVSRRTRLQFSPPVWGDTLGHGDWTVPADLAPELADSLLEVFREIERDTSATLYTVQLGVFREWRRAVRRWCQLDDLRPSENDEGDPWLRDTTLTVDWRHASCAESIRPNLFVFPDSGSTGPWRVQYRLFIDRNDAERAARRLRREHRVNGVVRALDASFELVQSAVRQWGVRGMIGSD